jgi:hypothetical protein
VDPGLRGAAVKEMEVPPVNCALQVPLVALIVTVQLMPAGLEVTSPLPCVALATPWILKVATPACTVTGMDPTLVSTVALSTVVPGFTPLTFAVDGPVD